MAEKMQENTFDNDFRIDPAGSGTRHGTYGENLVIPGMARNHCPQNIKVDEKECPPACHRILP